MDITLDYNVARAIGYRQLLEMLQKAYPQFSLYSISMDWMNDPQYICKAKGVHGDIIVSWS